MKTNVIYTTITNNYDALKPLPTTIGPDVECVVFLDQPATPESPWQYRPIDKISVEPRRNTRSHKILAHRSFPGAKYSLWIDGSIRVLFTVPLTQLIEQCLGDADIAMFKHQCRDCVYKEAETCSVLKLDEPMRIARQMRKYKLSGYPKDRGLHENPVILRRHTPAVQQFNELWWHELQVGSHRDQLSCDFAAWRTGVKIALLPGEMITTTKWFRIEPHIGKRVYAL